MSGRADDQKARIFVGNLGQETTVEDLRKRFEPHGTIVNINKNVKGFAFVQYETEEEAKTAMDKENGRLFKGKKIDVQPAQKNLGTAKGGDVGGGGKNPRGAPEKRGSSRDRDDRYGPSGDRYDRQDRGGGGGGGGWGNERDFRGGGVGDGRGGYQPPPFDGPGRGGGGFYGGEMGGGAPRPLMGIPVGPGGFRGTGSWENEGPGRNMMGGGMGGPMRGGPPAPVVEERVNDVEIICLNKITRAYAEAVESRLKNMGLTVDVLFPNPDIPLGKVLGNIAGRGVMYAVCVAPENETHRSLTVNVLQGEQQEHRNMPLDEAMSFVGKSFSRFIEKPIGGPVGGIGQLGFPPAAAGNAADQLPAFGHPNDIRTILGFLIDDRPMSIMEYDKLIKYLATRREGTLKAEYGANIPAHLLLPPVGPMQDPILKAKQEEIQNKVMEILNRPRKAAGGLAASAAQQKSASQSSVGGLNPTLQQAIDSLVKTGPNLLSSLGKTGPTAGGAEGSGASSGGEKNAASSNLGGYFASLFSGGSGTNGSGSGGGTMAGAY